jgi:peptide/nickel transport system substrate-binding protein
MRWGQDGAARFEIEGNTIVIHLQHDIYWHDGTPMTLCDLVFMYEVLAHQDYMGARFGANERQILGIMDFRDGLADSIYGLQLSNDNRTLHITMEELSPMVVYFGLWTSPMPRHIFGDIPVQNIRNSAEFRLNIGWGPFMYESSHRGTSVYMVRNPRYFRGIPYIERLEVQVVHQWDVGWHMERGDFDFAVMPSGMFNNYENPRNFRYLASVEHQYSFMSFRLGNFDWDTWEAIPNPMYLMNDHTLRRAIAHAIDFAELGRRYYSGLRFPAGSFMGPGHPTLVDATVPMFRYDPAYANYILCAAGFTHGEDGMRRMPDGSPLVINWLYMTNPGEEELSAFYFAAFENIGLHVQLWGGGPQDNLVVWDTLDYSKYLDLPQEQWVHIYMAGWSLGANPNPANRWGNAFWNSSLHNSYEWQALLARLDSPLMLEEEYRLAAFSALQWYMHDTLFFFPTTWGVTLSAISNRVANWDTRPGTAFGWHLVRLTAAG